MFKLLSARRHLLLKDSMSVGGSPMPIVKHPQDPPATHSVKPVHVDPLTVIPPHVQEQDIEQLTADKHKIHSHTAVVDPDAQHMLSVQHDKAVKGGIPDVKQ